ncbi:hypothetical protein GCM10027613_11400 [Microlunatus endophyticus]
MAREVAERDGWEAVTTRRLSEAIEYSQPVLYSHFPDGKAGIAAALALVGARELGAAIRDRRGLHGRRGRSCYGWPKPISASPRRIPSSTGSCSRRRRHWSSPTPAHPPR